MLIVTLLLDVFAVVIMGLLFLLLFCLLLPCWLYDLIRLLVCVWLLAYCV